MEKASVIVLTYNQESTIQRTIDSILSQQTSYSFKIYIGDDNSSDRTRLICEEYVNNHNGKVYLLPKAPNKGVVKNYFDVLGHCKGKYIMACAGDDWWHNPNKIQLQVDYMEANDECSLCYGAYREYYPFDDNTREMSALTYDNPLNQILLNLNYICAPTVCYRSKYITEDIINSFVSRDYRMEDLPLWLLLSLKGKFYAFSESLVSYTIQKGSLSHSANYEKQMAMLESSYKVRKYFVLDNNLEQEYGHLIEEFYFNIATRIAIQYGKQTEACMFVSKIPNPDWKWSLKKCMIRNKFAFNLLKFYYTHNLK